MTYQEWAEQYLEEADKLQTRIAELKAERETAPVSELLALERRIISLYDMRLDCLKIYNKLAKRKGVAFNGKN